MRESSHAELCAEHYQALKNPLYRQEFMMDVMREELSMELPWHNPDFGDARATQIVYRIRPVDKEIAQLKAKLGHLENKWNEHIDFAKKKNQFEKYETDASNTVTIVTETPNIDTK